MDLDFDVNMEFGNIVSAVKSSVQDPLLSGSLAELVDELDIDGDF
jgi:hypothetical protein